MASSSRHYADAACDDAPTRVPAHPRPDLAVAACKCLALEHAGLGSSPDRSLCRISSRPDRNGAYVSGIAYHRAARMLIRKAQAEDARAIAKVHVDSWRTTYAGIVASEFLAALSYEQREKTWRNVLVSAASQSFIYVAQAPNGEIVGFVSAGPERDGNEVYKGEIYALYLLQSYHRQGIGSLLFKASQTELKQRGIMSLLVWVLAANPSCKFYEALGGTYLRQKDIDIGNQRLVEVAYGWSKV